MVPPVELRRWIDPSSRGWYSGDLHLHRTIDELRNVVLAEDLNVVFPLTDWVTRSDTPPSAGDKNLETDVPDQLIHVDAEHLIWPRNTEYEIFTVGGQRHTLGALFVLGHRDALQTTVPPWKPVVDAARRADGEVIFDMDKLAWPFAMTLPVITPDATYELANNHMWRTEFAFRDWYTPAPAFIQPPYGGTAGGEREWIDLTLGMYYALLNCGFRLPPSAGTANGVHPVPAGFGRVYVHQPDGFDYPSWRRLLRRGRSFVTTGPIVFATINGRDAGENFEFASVDGTELTIEAEVISEQPVTFGEILVNGEPEVLLRPRQQRTAEGAHRGVIRHRMKPTTGWLALRFFEDRRGQRVRYAHTAPWYVSIAGQKVRPTWQQREYLVRRMRDEIERSRGVVSDAAIDEYERALAFYADLSVADDSSVVADTARPLEDVNRDRWLKNMIVDHKFSADEVRRATGMPIDRAEAEVERLRDQQPAHPGRVRLLPYPGGRHPRRGFLDGALDPQRETKISVFPSWDDGGYAVVDVPEAIFSNLGLTYLAHTHVPTLWTDRSIQLPRMEWTETTSGLEFTRRLPNEIVFGSRAEQRDDGVEMEMWLTNGTSEPLSGLRSQVCVMLKGLLGFNSQRKRDPVVRGSLIAVKADRSDRWLITGWEPNHRSWANPPVPCVHSDPIFPDCAPGETVRVRGGLWFYEGADVESQIGRYTEWLASAVADQP